MATKIKDRGEPTNREITAYNKHPLENPLYTTIIRDLVLKELSSREIDKKCKELGMSYKTVQLRLFGIKSRPALVHEGLIVQKMIEDYKRHELNKDRKKGEVEVRKVYSINFERLKQYLNDYIKHKFELLIKLNKMEIQRLNQDSLKIDEQIQELYSDEYEQEKEGEWKETNKRKEVSSHKKIPKKDYRKSIENILSFDLDDLKKLHKEGKWSSLILRFESKKKHLEETIKRLNEEEQKKNSPVSLESEGKIHIKEISEDKKKDKMEYRLDYYERVIKLLKNKKIVENALAISLNKLNEKDKYDKRRREDAERKLDNKAIKKINLKSDLEPVLELVVSKLSVFKTDKMLEDVFEHWTLTALKRFLSNVPDSDIRENELSFVDLVEYFLYTVGEYYAEYHLEGSNEIVEDVESLLYVGKVIWWIYEKEPLKNDKLKLIAREEIDTLLYELEDALEVMPKS